MSEWICKGQVGENPKASIMEAWEVASTLRRDVTFETPDHHTFVIKPWDTEKSLQRKYEAT